MTKQQAILAQATKLLQHYIDAMTPEFGELGQKVIINNQVFFIGDVVKLIDTKTRIVVYYQLIYSKATFRVVLENKQNGISNPNRISPPNPYIWYNKPYIEIFDITEAHIPYIKIERIGNDSKSLRLVKPKKRK